MIEVLDHRLNVVASCSTPDAAEAAARLLGAAWMRQEGAAWTMAVRVGCLNCARLEAELDAVARVRP